MCETWEAGCIASRSIVRLDCYLSRTGYEHWHIRIAGQESLAAILQAALLELDADKVSDRIAEAGTALVTRARELFHAAGIEEEQGVDDAMHALHRLSRGQGLAT